MYSPFRYRYSPHLDSPSFSYAVAVPQPCFYGAQVLVLLRRLQQWALAKRAKDHILQLVEHLDHLAMGFKDKYKG